MKNVMSVIVVMIVFAAGCGGGEIGSKSSQASNSVCKYDTYKCDGNSSYLCGYSGDDLLWILSAKCSNGCDSSTGKCKSANSSSGSSSNNDAETRRVNCQGLPENAEWNTVSTITQTWNGSSWLPVVQGTYNEISSTKECRFKCKKNYTWSGSKCRADSRVSNCTGLPANAEWNTVSNITQTWNGASWQPTTTGKYNKTPSSTECRYQCVRGYFWSGSSCVDPCESNPCRKIDNRPPDGGCISLDSENYKCECSEGFIWNGSVCIDPCSPNPCRGKEKATGICNVNEHSEVFYTCECLDTFTWNDKKHECLNPCDPNPCIGIENSTETCIKVDNFTTYSCECKDTFTWNDTEHECLSADSSCLLDASLINSDAEKYFGYKGIGKINPGDVAEPEWASLVKFALEGIEGKDLDYADNYSFFFETTLTGNDGSDILSVAVEALGDPNMSSDRFTTIAFAAVPIQYIDALKEAGADVFPSAPITQVIDLAFTSDNVYAKQCMIGVNKYAMSEDFAQEMPVGQFQVCYDNNETFAVGETFKLAMNAELGVGQEIVDMYSDVDTIDDLCTCFDLTATGDDDTVDCNTIDEFAYSNSSSGSSSNNDAETRKVNCQGLPSNANWNTVSTVTQTWNGTEWIPINVGTYNTTASTEECRFQCNSGYRWNNSQCELALPACFSTTPCQDRSNGLFWSSKSSNAISYTGAISYCNNITEGNFDDWRLPTIDELRTLIQNCSSPASGGSCGLTDPYCLSASCHSNCSACTKNDMGLYSKFKDTGYFWSSSSQSDSDSNYVWLISFSTGALSTGLSGNYYVRCVR